MKIKFIATAALCSLSLTLMSCNGSNANAPLIGTNWSLIEYQGRPFESIDNYKILLNDEGGISGVADCNSFMGDYNISNKGEISVANKALTRAMCPNDAMEQSFLKMLEAVDNYKINGNRLEWIDDDVVVGVFEARPNREN